MIAHIEEELGALATQCGDELEDLGMVNGWQVLSWAMSEPAIELMLDCYAVLLAGGPGTKIMARLRRDSVPVDELLVNEENADPQITRADLCELAAAATLIDVEDLDAATIHMPNVPKGQRSASEHGIDAMGARIDETLDDEDFSSDEVVVICSAKHTVKDAGDVRRKIVASLDESKELTAPYVMSQLRVLDGNLKERGIAGERVYLAMTDFPDSRYVKLVGVAFVSSELLETLHNGMSRLPDDSTGTRNFRCVSIEGLGSLHERVA